MSLTTTAHTDDQLLAIATERGAMARTLAGHERWQAYSTFKSYIGNTYPRIEQAVYHAAVDAFLEAAEL